MPFISSSEAKNSYFMSGEAMNEIYIFSLHEMKEMAYSFQKMNFLFIIYNLKRDGCFAQNDVIHVRTLRHINADVA